MVELASFKEKFSSDMIVSYERFLCSDKFNEVVMANELYPSSGFKEVVKLAFYQGGADALASFKHGFFGVFKRYATNPRMLIKFLKEVR